MNKLKKLLLIPIITIVSYIFCDDPNPDPEFMKLSFWGRMKYYYEQMKSKEVEEFFKKVKEVNEKENN